MRLIRLPGAVRKVRRSTVILCVLFAGVFVLYLWVRPVPVSAPAGTTGIVRPAERVTSSQRARPTASRTPSRTATRTASSTARPSPSATPTNSSTPATGAPSGSPTTAPTTTAPMTGTLSGTPATPTP